jgi:hypothetical protein
VPDADADGAGLADDASVAEGAAVGGGGGPPYTAVGNRCGVESLVTGLGVDGSPPLSQPTTRLEAMSAPTASAILRPQKGQNESSMRTCRRHPLQHVSSAMDGDATRNDAPG